MPEGCLDHTLYHPSPSFQRTHSKRLQVPLSTYVILSSLPYCFSPHSNSTEWVLLCTGTFYRLINRGSHDGKGQEEEFKLRCDCKPVSFEFLEVCSGHFL